MNGSCIHHLPDLHNVVLRYGADDPGFIRVPGEIGDLGCVAPMDKLMETANQQVHIVYSSTTYCFTSTSMANRMMEYLIDAIDEFKSFIIQH